MNEKIKELAEHAKLDNSWYVAGQGFLINDTGLEKFAGLIVQECLNICAQALAENEHTLAQLSDKEMFEKMVAHGAIKQTLKVGIGIKEHFGVKL